MRTVLVSLMAALLLGSAQPAPAAADDAAILHVLNRLGYGPRPGDVERVRAMGLPAYVEQQLHPERLPDGDLQRRLAGLRTLKMSAVEIALHYPRGGIERSVEELKKQGKMEEASRLESMLPPEDQRGRPRDILQELVDQKIIRAVHSPRQLEEVMVDFWMNHFNVNWNKAADRYLVTSYERDVIRPHALGKFRDLLLATAQSPAMLFYLDNWQSTGPNATLRGNRKAGLNENYARELMELHTLGVDGGYTQKDVVEVARCLTGWTLKDPRRGATYEFRSAWHDDGVKVVLGRDIAAGGGERDGVAVIDLLSRSPRTARFIATKLCRRFVSDDPPAALVDRVARTFLETDGDIRQTVRAVVTSAEFGSPQVRRAKIKTPLELVASSIRAVDGETRGGMTLTAALNRLGMVPYMCVPPTGYADKAEAWVSAGALLERLSFAIALMEGRMVGTEVPAPGDASIDRLVQALLGGQCSPETRQTLLTAGENVTGAKRVGLVLGSPEFQRR